MKFTKIFLFILLAFFSFNIASVNAIGVTGDVTVTVLKTQEALVVTTQTVTYPTAFEELKTTGGSGSGTVSFSIVNDGTASGCTISGTSLTYSSAGTCKVTATKLGDTEYNSITSDTATFTINPASLTSISISGTAKVGQTLTSSLLPQGAIADYQWKYSLTSGGTPTPISGATGSTYTIPSDSNLIGKYIKVVATGTGNYSGTVTSNALGPIVDKINPTCSVNNTSISYTGSQVAAIISTDTPSTVNNVKYSSSSTIPTTAGSYIITADLVPDDQTNFNNVNGVTCSGGFTIIAPKITPTCSVNNTSISYTGSQVPVVISSVPTTTNPTDVRYNGSPTVPTAVGSYTITAVLNPTDTSYNSPYTATCSGGFEIGEITISVIANPLEYLTAPNRNVNFTYTPNTNSGGVQCQLLDYQLNDVTSYINAVNGAVNTISHNSPDGISAYSYYIRCKNTTDQTIIATSNQIKVGTTCLIFNEFGACIPETGNSNLSAYGVTPTKVIPGASTLFSAKIKNEGNASTNRSFNYLLQFASSADGGGNVESIIGGSVESNMSADEEVTINFNKTYSTLGTYSIQVCADQPTSFVAESNEDDNCSGWTNIFVDYSVTASPTTYRTTAGTNVSLTYTTTVPAPWCRILDYKKSNITEYSASTSSDSRNLYIPSDYLDDYAYYIQCANQYNSGINATSEMIIVSVGATLTPLTSISISGIAQVGQTLTSTLLPQGATASYRWEYYSTPAGSPEIISGAIVSTYKIASGLEGKYIKVVATGTGSYSGIVKSTAFGPVVNVTVTASPLTYDVKRRTPVSFTYTSSTNSGAGTECRLLDNNLDINGNPAYNAKTSFQSASPIVYTVPNTVNDFGYHIQCRDKITTSVTATSELIHVKTKPIIRFDVFDLDHKGTVKKLINGSLVDVTDSFENDEDHVNYGSNQTYLFSPNNSPYMILYIDTILVPLSNPSDPYTQYFNNITSDHEISIKFIPNYPYCDIDTQICYYGSLSSSPNPCTIASGESSCTTSLTLNITNPVSGAATNITKAGNITVASGITPTIKTGIVVPYGNTTFYLNHNTNTLADETVGAICISGTIWNGTVCAPTIYGCKIFTDTNYDADGPDNNWNCAGTCANGYTNYSECTIPPVCANGATDYPTCIIQPVCANGATDYPVCSEFDPVGQITASDCMIAESENSCTSNLSWYTTNPLSGVTSAVTTPTDITVKSANTSTATYPVSYGSRNFFLYHNGVELYSDTANATCDPATTTWNGTVCAPTIYGCKILTDTNYDADGPDNNWNCAGTCANGATDYSTCIISPEPPADPTGELIATGCTIQAGESSCNTKLTWETINPKNGVTSVIKTPDINGTQITTGNINEVGVNYSITIGETTFVLVHNGIVIKSAKATAAEAGDCEWDGATSTCVEKDPNIKFFNATPNPIFEGKSSKLSWEAEFVDSCSISAEGASPVTDLPLSGSIVVKPTETTTYTLSCNKINGSSATSDQTIKIVTINIKEN